MGNSGSVARISEELSNKLNIILQENFGNREREFAATDWKEILARGSSLEIYRTRWDSLFIERNFLYKIEAFEYEVTYCSNCCSLDVSGGYLKESA